MTLGTNCVFLSLQGYKACLRERYSLTTLAYRYFILKDFPIFST